MADLVSANVQDFQEWQFIHLVPDVSIGQYQSSIAGTVLLWETPENCLFEC